MQFSQKFSGSVPACVLGDLDLLRPLGMAGIPCALVTSPGGIPRHSRLCRGVIPWEETEIADSGEEFVLVLEAFADAQAAQPILFYQEDEQLLFISRNRERLAHSFRFVIADPDLVEDLVDKARFQELAERLQLPVPPTRRIRPRVGEPPPVIDLRYPVIAKPLRRRRTWADSGYDSKAVRIATPDAFGAYWPQWCRLGMELLVQELVPGPESCIESYHVYIDGDGGVAGEFAGRKIRTFPTEFGYSTALTITDAADVLELGRSLVETLGLRGVAKFDFKRDPSGGLHLLEVNPRFNLWHHLGAAAGLNLPELVYRDLLGLSRPTPAKARPGARWCRLSDDWRAARASGIPLHHWLPWALRCDAKTVSWADPLPFIHTLWHAVSGRMAPA